MKKNGFTTIELIICFVIISVISISLFGVVMHFREQQQIESIRSEVLTYKYSLTKTIQDDVIKNGVYNVTYNTEGGIDLYLTSGYTKSLFVNSEYSIGYDGINYPLPNIDGLEFGDNTFFNLEQVGSTNTYFVTVNIPISHPDLTDQDYAINIIFPYLRT